MGRAGTGRRGTVTGRSRRRIASVVALAALGLGSLAVAPEAHSETIPTWPGTLTLAKRRPLPGGRVQISQTVTFGYSRQGRPMRAYRIGEHGKPVVVIMATMHGNERQARAVVDGLMSGLLIRGADVWVIPVANPDGYAANSRYLSTGVDPNRNYPIEFTPSSVHGPYAASEPETRAMMNFLNARNPRYVVSLHQPYNSIDLDTKDQALARRLAANLGLPLKTLYCTTGCGGSMVSWFNATHSGAAITVEFSASPDVTWLRTKGALGVLTAVGGH